MEGVVHRTCGAFNWPHGGEKFESLETQPHFFSPILPSSHWGFGMEAGWRVCVGGER